MGTLAKILAGLVVVAAALLAGTCAYLRRPDLPYADLEARWAAPGSKYVDLPGGVRMRYLDQGNAKGPVILLLHGFAMSADTWAGWTQKLSGQARVVAVDLPGFGLTRSPEGKVYSYDQMAETLHDFVQAEHLGRVVVAGSSMGGDVAWRFALAHPEETRGLILVDAAGFAHRSAVADAPLVKLAHVPELGPLVLQLDDSRELRDGFCKAFADPSRASDAYVQRYAELSRAPGRRAAWIGLLDGRSGQDVATPERLSAIKAPTLILWGADDHLEPPKAAWAFLSAIPGSHLIVYPDTGHLPQEEATDASAADVSAFLHGFEPPKKVVSTPGIPGAAPTTSAGAFYTPKPPPKPDAKQMVFY